MKITRRKRSEKNEQQIFKSNTRLTKKKKMKQKLLQTLTKIANGEWQRYRK